MWLLRRAVIGIIRTLIRLVFFPYFAFLDWQKSRELKQHGDLVSERKIREATGGIFCIFHLYPRHHLPKSVIRALTVLERLGANLIIISNGAIPEGDMPFVESVAHTIIIRRNIGRDFGGYRTGVLHVLEKYQPSRLLVVNDSVYFLEHGLEPFFRALCAPHEYVGAAENHEFGYHVGSYALGFGPKVFNSPHFKAFWQNYELSELRPKVIRTGEIGLNRVVIGKIGATPHVVYSPRRLGDALAKLPTTELIATASRMPAAFPERDALRKLQVATSQWFDPSAPQSRTGAAMRSIDGAAALAETSQTAMLKLVSASYRQQLERSLMDFVFRGSQIHWGALPFVRHLDCPIIKADLVLRGIYGVGELSGFADSMSVEEYEEFFAMCTRRGVPDQHWSPVQRMMLAVGYI